MTLTELYYRPMKIGRKMTWSHSATNVLLHPECFDWRKKNTGWLRILLACTIEWTRAAGLTEERFEFYQHLPSDGPIMFDAYRRWHVLPPRQLPKPYDWPKGLL